MAKFEGSSKIRINCSLVVNFENFHKMLDCIKVTRLGNLLNTMTDTNVHNEYCIYKFSMRP